MIKQELQHSSGDLSPFSQCVFIASSPIPMEEILSELSLNLDFKSSMDSKLSLEHDEIKKFKGHVV